MTKFKCFVMLFLFSGSTAIFSQEKPRKKFNEIRSSRHWLDVDYVGDGIIAHKMDIHLPETEALSYPVVMTIYGSAWFSNNRKGDSYQSGIGQYLLKNGYAVVSVNHRSSRDSVFPAQLHDIKAAIRFIRANAADFSLDADRIGVTGWSSGGHLAAMLGTTSNIKEGSTKKDTLDLEGNLGNHTDMASSVQAVVDYFGPTDFLIMDECGSSFSHDGPKSPESSLIGGAIQDNPDKAALADPVTYIHKDIPPFLIFHGDEDPLVPHCQSEHLHTALREKGHSSNLHIIKGGKHGPGVMITPHYAKMIEFFNENLR